MRSGSLYPSESLGQIARAANVAHLRNGQPPSGNDQGIRTFPRYDIIQIGDIPGSSENAKGASEIGTGEQNERRIGAGREKTQTFDIIVEPFQVSNAYVAAPHEPSAPEILIPEQE